MENKTKAEFEKQIEEAGREIAYYRRLIQESSNIRLRETEELSRLIIDLKDTQKALQKARDELEKRVEERTAELASANLVLNQEILERSKIEEALRESEKRFRSLSETISDWVWELDRNGVYTYSNPKVLDLLGYEPTEVLGKQPLYFMPREEQERIGPLWTDLVESRKPIYQLQNVNLHKNGRQVILETSGVPILDEGGNYSGYRGIDRDVSERRRIEEALRENEAKYRLLFERSNDAIFLIDSWTDRYLDANRAAEKLTGRSVDELKRLTTSDVSPKGSVDCLEQLRGSNETIELNEVEYVRPDGTIRTALVDVIPLPGNIFCGVAYDITDRKRAEEEKQNLQERLKRAEKMEALGQLAGGVAHDLNNVLGILSGYSELLLMEIPEGSHSRGHVEKILQSTEKGAAIIQDLLTLARRGVTVSDVINLNSVVWDFLKTPAFEKIKDYHPRVTFRTECDSNLLNIKGSTVHLEKTLMNLVSNAAEAISVNGQVTIRTENRYLDTLVKGYDEIRQGDYVVLIVSDTGMGIPPENREKIFEPFYTKKAMGKSGTGLGLAIVWGTIKDHYGYIDVQTEVGNGTTFTLFFPVTRDELIQPQQKTPIERYMGKGESVLVVDDIAEQRDIAARLLTRLGYQVLVVSSGEDAVEYLKGNKADILVLDMIMSPGIDGMETYQRVLEINPKQKAILVSGFSETDRVKEALKLGAGAYVKKPYVMEKIGIAIRDELTR